ncbi:hypothetical protein [Floccifex sp.]|uniref:hypothetical protein n=1 Tax=Floccifex sp. TaxID=2815810 RepID=UPI003F0FB660
MKKKRIFIFILVLLLGIGYMGYYFYAFSYRYENEPETDLTETNTDSILTIEQLSKNLSSYEDLQTLNLNDLEQTSYIIPGLLATKTLASDSSHAFSMCTSMTPQGICLTEKYVFISAYCHTHSHNSVLYMIDKNTHQFIKEIILSGKPHAGNIAYDDIHNTIWIACTGQNVITGEKSAYLNCVSLEAIEQYDFNATMEPITYDKKYNIEGFSSASFISYYRNNLFVGHYYEGEWKDSYVVRFPITEDGGLETRKVMGNKEIAVGKEKAIIDQYCQGLYLDTGYCVLIQSSGTKDSKVQSFVNSQFQQDVEEMIDLDEQYHLYQQQQEVIQNLLDSLEEMNQEYENILDQIEDLTEKKDFLKESEEKEEYKDVLDEISSLKEQKRELEIKILNLKKEVNLEKKDAIEFDVDAYNKRLKETKVYSLQDDLADRTFTFPARLEQAMISEYGNYSVYLLFESGAYSYRAQKNVDIVDRVIVWG